MSIQGIQPLPPFSANDSSSIEHENRGLNGDVLELFAEVKRQFPSGDHLASAVAKYLTDGYAKADAELVSRSLLEIFIEKPEKLGGFVRVVDVANELAHGSNALGRAVIRQWSAAKEDHKLSRLAEELLNTVSRFKHREVAVFLLHLSCTLALHRPELASRLVAAAKQMSWAEVDESHFELARAWLGAGEFLNTQAEPVRFFWREHLRRPIPGDGWDRQSARVALDVLHKAMIEDEVREVFRNTVPDDVWEGKWRAAPNVVIEVAPTLVVVPPHSIEAADDGVEEASKDHRPEFISTYAPRVSWLHGTTGLKPSPSATRHASKQRWQHIAAAAALLGMVMIGWHSTAGRNVASAIQQASSHTEPVQVMRELTPAMQPQAKPAPMVVTTETKAVEVIPQPVAKPVSPSMTATAKKSKVVMVSATPKQPEPAASIEPAPVIEVLTASVSTMIHPQAQIAARPSLMRSAVAPVPSPKPVTPKVKDTPPSRPSLPVAVEMVGPPVPEIAVEKIARPLAISDFDRWVMTQTHRISERFPELIELQQTVVKGTWDERALKINGRPLTDDRERYLAILRWLVIDPPVSAATRSLVLELWSMEADAEECVSLWEEVIKGSSISRHEICVAAQNLIDATNSRLNAAQRARLRTLVANYSQRR